MFGGIPASFYETYHTHLPETEPSDQYELRQELYELFHYLNHTLIFGVSKTDINRCIVNVVCCRVDMLEVQCEKSTPC